MDTVFSVKYALPIPYLLIFLRQNVKSEKYYNEDSVIADLAEAPLRPVVGGIEPCEERVMLRDGSLAYACQYCGKVS